MTLREVGGGAYVRANCPLRTILYVPPPVFHVLTDTVSKSHQTGILYVSAQLQQPAEITILASREPDRRDDTVGDVLRVQCLT